MAVRMLAQRRHPFLVRSFTVSPVRGIDAASGGSKIVPTPPPKSRKIGGIRGGIFGFLLGFASACAFASYQLLDEYRLSSAILQSSIGELQSSTHKVSAHVRRIETVEKELKALAERTAAKEDVTRLRAEMKKLYDGLHIEFLDLRSTVWGLQQDIHKLSKDREPVKVQ